MTAQLLIENPSCAWAITNVGVGGATVSSTQGIIDGIVARYTITQQIVLLNLGANDVAALPSESAWKTSYQYSIDAFKTKWPTIKIYITKPWRRGYATECNTLAGWIDALIAANPGICFVADDERTWMEGGDDGLTMTADGVHPNTTGYAEKVNQMVTALGY